MQFDDDEGSGRSEDELGLWDLDPANQQEAEEMDYSEWLQEQHRPSGSLPSLSHEQAAHEHMPAADQPPEQQQQQHGSTRQATTADPQEEVERWLRANAGKQIVAAKRCKRITKESRFEGEKPSWVFKSGEHWLGYYADQPKPVAVSLWDEICPSGGYPFRSPN